MSSSQMPWSYDYCLTCDRQIAESGAYCSQSCRLADLERAGNTPSSHFSSSASSTSSSNNGFFLPPAVNFSAYKSSTPSRGSSVVSPGKYHPANYGVAQPTLLRPSLTPSSSQSSLASAASQPQSGVSQTAQSQLNHYMRSFDQTRGRRYQC